MTPVMLNSKVDGDGVLRLSVPLGQALSGQEVQVTVAAVRRPLTQEEWTTCVLATAGSIPDPTFMRHEQGEYEKRDELP